MSSKAEQFSLGGGGEVEVDISKEEENPGDGQVLLSEVIKMETQALLKVFPEEIWEKVLQNVTDLDDLESLTESSPFFKPRLEQHRVLSLFPKVLPILYPFVQAELLKDFKIFLEKDDTEMLSALNAMGYGQCTDCGRQCVPKDFSNFLKLRLVCKAWCVGVDNFFENLDCKFEMTHDKCLGYPMPGYWTSQSTSDIEEWTEVNFGKTARVRAFMEHFKNSHGNGDGPAKRNPFIGRTIYLSWSYCDDVWKCDMDSGESDNDDDTNSGTIGNGNDQDGDDKSSTSGSGSGDDSDWEDISSEDSDASEQSYESLGRQFAKIYNNQVLLKKFGHHVWYCTISIYDNAMPSQESCAWLRKMLSLMPNLKVLRIQYDENVYAMDLDNPSSWLDRDCGDETEFPKLEKLEFLSGSQLCAHFVDEILKQNWHVKKLELQGYRNQTDFWYRSLAVLPAETFKELSVAILDSQDFEDFKKLEVDWKLEKLYLEVNDDYYFTLVSRKKVLNWVKDKFGGSLKTFAYNGNHIRVEMLGESDSSSDSETSNNSG